MLLHPNNRPGAHANKPINLALVANLTSGGTVTLLDVREVVQFNSSRDKYLAELRFTENTDMQDLDRLLQQELLIYRWNQWITSGLDYEGTLIDEYDVAAKLKFANEQVNRLKDQMGMSRKVRDASGSSVADMWIDLKRRAKEFGYSREEQLRGSLVLMNEISATVGTFYRSDEDERKKSGFENEQQIVEWLRDIVIPAYADIDQHFIQNTQRMWQQP